MRASEIVSAREHKIRRQLNQQPLANRASNRCFSKETSLRHMVVRLETSCCECALGRFHYAPRDSFVDTDKCRKKLTDFRYPSFRALLSVHAPVTRSLRLARLALRIAVHIAAPLRHLATKCGATSRVRLVRTRRLLFLCWHREVPSRCVTLTPSVGLFDSLGRQLLEQSRRIRLDTRSPRRRVQAQVAAWRWLSVGRCASCLTFILSWGCGWARHSAQQRLP